MSKIKHLLFDCDGVLVDTEYIAAIKMTQALQNLDVDISVDYYLKNFSGTTFSSVVRHYFNNLPEDETIRIIDKVEDQVATETKLIEGVDKMLDKLIIDKYVVSNSSLKTVQHALKCVGIAHHFSSEVYSSELVENPKPAPDIYKHACASIGCQQSEILVIEDSISGVKAALEADLQVIGFVGGTHILSGHDQKLSELGVMRLASNTQELELIIQDLIKE